MDDAIAGNVVGAAQEDAVARAPGDDAVLDHIVAAVEDDAGRMRRKLVGPGVGLDRLL